MSNSRDRPPVVTVPCDPAEAKTFSMSSTPDNKFQNRPDFVAVHEFMALLGPGAMSDLVRMRPV